MKLSKRMQAICDLVPNNSNIIDVGADHALISIYLNKYKNCNVLATDISDKCIEKALNNIKKYKANVQTQKTDGLKNISLENKIIIISGMGADNIMQILDKKIKNDLIISSNTKNAVLKKYLYKKGYHIYKETVIKEKHYYVITYYKYGKRLPQINPAIKQNKEYAYYIYKKYEKKYTHERKIYKKIKYKYTLNRLKKYIN